MGIIIGMYLILILTSSSFSRRLPFQLKQFDEELFIFPDDVPVNLDTRINPFDEASYVENEQICLSEKKFLFEGVCHSPGTKGSCAQMELLFLVKPNNSNELLKLACKKKPCTKSNEVWWPSLQRCELKSIIKSKYCQDENKLIVTNSFGDAVCRCKSNMGEIQKITGCHEYYQRGPCKSNEVVTYDLATGYGICSLDLCADLNKSPVYSYAPFEGKGICYKLKSPEPCIDVDEHSRFVVDNVDYVPRCSVSTPLFVAFAPLQCKVDDKKKCRKPVHLQSEDRLSYLTRLKHEIFN